MNSDSLLLKTNDSGQALAAPTISARFLCFCLTVAATLPLAACKRDSTPPPPKPRTSIAIVMKKFAITPKVIHVHRGEIVQLLLSSADVQHGFNIPSLKISEPIAPGKTAQITLRAPAAGEYKIECGILCGKGHDDMSGVLVVD